MEIKSIFPNRLILGESPVWDPRSHLLYFIDIVKPALYSFNPMNDQIQTWIMPMAIGSIALHQQGGLIAALQTGFAHIDLPSGEVTMLNTLLAADANTMFNDGKCDRQGRFWAGTKDKSEQNPIGDLYRLDATGKTQIMDSGFTVTNGIAWSPDNKIMYACDSPARKIYRYDFNSLDGTISNKTVFAHIAADAGYPDGLTVDNTGHVWSAHWDGWRITRYHPNGSIDQVINMPVQRPTSCCFGGPNLQTLFITSASINLTATALQAGPLAGQVFALETSVTGIKEPLCATPFAISISP